MTLAVYIHRSTWLWLCIFTEVYDCACSHLHIGSPLYLCVCPQWIVYSLLTVCQGTSTGLGHQGTERDRYNFYQTRYTNCTLVNGNLEIVWLSERNYNLSFLKNIQEVTGYVIVVALAADKLPLYSLRIIRGKDLFEHQNKYYSLYVALNYRPGGRQGLKYIYFTSLHGESTLTFANLLNRETTFLELGEVRMMFPSSIPHITSRLFSQVPTWLICGQGLCIAWKVMLQLPLTAGAWLSRQCLKNTGQGLRSKASGKLVVKEYRLLRNDRNNA